ncbi:MAG: biotin--[acetyl-CoA-carboxylase] ligase [bacterium]
MSLIRDSHIIHLKEAVSTNDEAHLLAKKGFPNGTLVVADYQTGGRGRRGAKWSSPEGGLYISILLRLKEWHIEAPIIEKWATIAVWETVNYFIDEHSTIKPPNDILIKGRKVAGILVETRYTGTRLHYIVAGIGINVCPDMEEFPQDLRMRAISLCEVGKDRALCKCDIVLDRLIAFFNTWYSILVKDGPEGIRKQWEKIA